MNSWQIRSLLCLPVVAKAAAVPALQVLTPAMLHTIFRRMCDPDNPNNLAGTSCSAAC